MISNNDIEQHVYLIGGFNPTEKYESQSGLLFPIYGKIKNVPNHQPGILYIIIILKCLES